MHGTSRKCGKYIKTLCIGSMSNLLNRKDLSSIRKRSNAIILYDTLPACCIPKAIMMETGETIYEKVFVSPRPPPKISFEDNWMKELDSEVSGGTGDSQQIQPTSKTQLSSTGRLVKSEQPSGSPTQESEKRVLFGCEGTNSRTGRLVKSCVPVSVERVGKDKDADENVDADHVRTGRLVKSGQSIGLFTQARGNRHRLQSVWIATCSCETSRELPCSRTREEDRKSSSSRSTSSRLATK